MYVCFTSICHPCCSLVQLQEEKERQFHENRASFEEMVRSKDHEIHTLQNKMALLNRDLETKSQVSAAAI